MAASTTTGNFKVIGTRPIRHDGVDKVTGRAKYGADYAFPGMLHGKVLRSPHAHANIKSINIDKALKLPGVKAVVTGKDLPKAENKLEQAGEMVINPMYLSMNILAHDKVLYDGHAIAAVAATSPHIAEEALRLIEVEYEVLPPVMTVDVATKPGAPILLKDLRNKEEGDKPTNVAQHYQFKRGDVAEGFLRPPAGVGEVEGRVGPQREFCRFASRAVAQGPRLRARGLENEIEARDLAVRDFSPGRRRCELLDLNVGQHEPLPRKSEDRGLLPCYQILQRVTKRGRLGLLPRVHDTSGQTRVMQDRYGPSRSC